MSENSGILIDRYVRKSFEDNGFEQNPIVVAALCKYLRQLIYNDNKAIASDGSEKCAFEVVATEGFYKRSLEIESNGKPIEVNLKGTIDRLDLVNIDGITTARVVDYKTGGKIESADSVEQLFEQSEKRPHYVFQTFLYSYLLSEKDEFKRHPIAPALFFVHKAAGDDYRPYIKIEGEECYDFRPYEKEFEDRLKSLLVDILDMEKPFRATDNPKNCANCNFKILCNR